MTTQEQRAEWSALAQAATPGEWCEITQTGDWYISGPDAKMHYVVGTADMSEENIAFIAAARAAVPALLADVDAANARADALAAELASCRNRLVLAQNHNEMHERLWREAETLRQTEVDALAAELVRVRGELAGYLDGDEGAIAERNAALVELARVRTLLADVENYAAMQYENGRRYEPRRFETYSEWRSIYRQPQA